MTIALKSLADDQELQPFSRMVLEQLQRYTAFPWPILAAQCRRGGVDPTSLSPSGLQSVMDYIVKAVERFTSPEKATKVREDLQRLIEAQTGSA